MSKKYSTTTTLVIVESPAKCKKIEDGELDQHEGSFMVGSILKELYIDSALKKSEKLDAMSEKSPEPKRADVKISWNQFKKINK